MKRFCFILLAAAVLFGCAGTDVPENGKLVIYHAGSLAVPFSELEAAFEAKYPGTDVVREAAGSRKCARKITELGKEADIMASADYTVIENLMFDKFADWNISFVTNEMSVMYSEKSRYNDLINTSNWFEIILRDDVSVGRSNPNADPCGYRALLVWQLAEKYYGVDGLYERLLNKKNTMLRDKEVDLVSMVEAGELDYLFIYRSVSQQHKAPYIVLDDHINLKTGEFSDFYSQASVEISGKAPGEFITQTGAPMVYGITIPKNAPNPELAEKFLLFLFSEEGVNIMENNGQGFMRPPVVTGKPELLPAKINKALKKIK